MGSILSRPITENNARSEFYRAAQKGDVRRASLILEKFPDRKAELLKGAEYLPPIEAAIISNQPNFVRFLLQNGVDPDEKISNSETATSLAFLFQRLEIAKILLDAGAEIPVMHPTALDFTLSKAHEKKGKYTQLENELALRLIKMKTLCDPNNQIMIIKKSKELAIIYRYFNDDSMSDQLRSRIQDYTSQGYLNHQLSELMLMPFEQFCDHSEVKLLIENDSEIKLHTEKNQAILSAKFGQFSAEQKHDDNLDKSVVASIISFNN